ncbi:hypothetical protein [Mesorhizobium sp. M0129]
MTEATLDKPAEPENPERGTTSLESYIAALVEGRPEDLLKGAA